MLYLLNLAAHGRRRAACCDMSNSAAVVAHLRHRAIASHVARSLAVMAERHILAIARASWPAESTPTWATAIRSARRRRRETTTRSHWHHVRGQRTLSIPTAATATVVALSSNMTRSAAQVAHGGVGAALGEMSRLLAVVAGGSGASAASALGVLTAEAHVACAAADVAHHGKGAVLCLVARLAAVVADLLLGAGARQMPWLLAVEAHAGLVGQVIGASHRDVSFLAAGVAHTFAGAGVALVPSLLAVVALHFIVAGRGDMSLQSAVVTDRLLIAVARKVTWLLAVHAHPTAAAAPVRTEGSTASMAPVSQARTPSVHDGCLPGLDW